MILLKNWADINDYYEQNTIIDCCTIVEKEVNDGLIDAAKIK